MRTNLVLIWIVLTSVPSVTWALNIRDCRFLLEQALDRWVTPFYPVSSQRVLTQLVYSNYDSINGQTYRYYKSDPRNPQSPYKFWVRDVSAFETRLESYARLKFPGKVVSAIETLLQAFLSEKSASHADQLWRWQEKAELLILTGKLKVSEVPQYLQLWTLLKSEGEPADVTSRKRVRPSAPYWDSREDLVLVYLRNGMEKFDAHQMLLEHLWGNREAAYHMIYKALFTQEQADTFTSLYQWMIGLSAPIITVKIQDISTQFYIPKEVAINLAYRMVVGGFKPSTQGYYQRAVQYQFPPRVIAELAREGSYDRIHQRIQNYLNKSAEREASIVLGLQALPESEIHLEYTGSPAWRVVYRD